MNKRKILTLAMTLSLVAILAIGGTLAYFTDNEQKTNTMTIGNVMINIEELEQNPDWEEGSEVEKFIQFNQNDFHLYPIDDAQGRVLFNKMVYTYNTSPSKDDAYIRTIVLFEHNEGAKCDADCCLDGIHFSYGNEDHGTGIDEDFQGSTNQILGVMTVDNVDYHVVVFTDMDKEAIPYNNALAAINGVWLDKNVTQTTAAAWNGAIDIKVLSQAIQATGLTHDQAMAELGDITAENLTEWFGTDDAVVNDWIVKEDR